MTAHACQDCGMLHDTPVQVESPEVQIARIRAETELAIAQLQARADKHMAEVEAEAAVDVAEAQAEAIVEALSDPEPVEQEPAEEPAPEPIAIIQDVDQEVEEPDAPPKVEHDEHPAEERPAKKRGLGFF